ncbi:MAG: MATE family efflux transporter [Lachnospiraceae bacterium]|nr:MATE family efflux transporter [Lachnospiraceae bacterium]
MKKDLTQGNVTKTLLLFAYPMILGNLLQQCYNIADTLIVGRFLGPDALAAVGSAYSLMTFLTSIIIGLCMGSGTVYSVWFGRKDKKQLKSSMVTSFGFIVTVTVIINILVFAGIDFILRVLRVPPEIYALMREYVWIIFSGIFFVFLYNYFAFLLRAIGNSVTPLFFLGIAAVLNIALDIAFVAVLGKGVGGAAYATIISQAVSGLGIGVYVWFKEKELRPKAKEVILSKTMTLEVVRNSAAACVQQSVMNFGILMIQGLVNSFGAAVMAAFAAAVKIDSFAYMPAQEFGNAFSLFISQNYGGGRMERVREGIRKAVKVSASFCLAVSALIFILAPYLMQIFVDNSEVEIIRTGVGYLRVEGSFYCGIGILFLLYGFYRGIEKPEMSLVLTIISLGTRVLLAYLLAPHPSIGVWGIWWAIPIGWFLADLTGILCIRKSWITPGVKTGS